MRPFDGYPTSWGNTRVSLFPHAGPASYTQVTFNAAGAVITPGDTVQAVEAGLKYFDKVDGAITDDGHFQLQVYRSSLLSQSNASLGPPMTFMYVRWIALVTATYAGQAQTAGTEAVAGSNLSTFVAALEAIGPK